MLCPTFTILVLLCLAYCHPTSSSKTTQEKHIDRLIAEATAKGYAIERQGFVDVKQFKCGTVIFDYGDWRSGKNFWKAAKKLETNQNYNETVDIISAVGKDLIRDLRQIFEEKTEHLLKSKATTMETLKPVETIKMNKVHKKTESNPSYEDNIEKELMADKRTAMMVQIAHQHKLDFVSVLDAFRDGTITNLIIDEIGGDKIYEGIIAKIIGHNKYNGSLAEELKERLARAITFNPLMAVGRDSIAVEICVPDMYLASMRPLFEIRPIGTINGDLYSEYVMPKHYAFFRDFETMADLSVVDNFVYQQHGYSIVSSFKQQEQFCNLESPLKCQTRSYNLTEHGGTMVFSMKRLSIVATTKEYGNCTNGVGMMKLESHVFVHNHGQCTLQVGDELVGDTVFGVKLVPREYRIYAFHDEPVVHHAHNTMFNFTFTWTFTIGAVVAITIVIALILVLYCLFGGPCKKIKDARHNKRVAGLIDKMIVNSR